MARLQRTLSLGSVVLFGIANMTPIIVLGTFGISCCSRSSAWRRTCG